MPAHLRAAFLSNRCHTSGSQLLGLTLTMGSVPVAAFASGVLADRFGIGMPLVLWPAITLTAALAFLALVRDA